MKAYLRTISPEIQELRLEGENEAERFYLRESLAPQLKAARVIASPIRTENWSAAGEYLDSEDIGLEVCLRVRPPATVPMENSGLTPPSVS